MSVGLGGGVCLARMGKAQAGRHSFVVTLFVISFLTLYVGGSWVAQGHYPNGIYWIIFGLAQLIFAIVVSNYESQLIAAFLVGGLFLWTWDQIMCLVIYNESVAECVASPPYSGVLMVSFACLAYLYRLRSMALCKRLIMRDKQSYDALWEALVADPDSRQMLTQLADVAEALPRPDLAQTRQFRLRPLLKQLLLAQQQHLEIYAALGGSVAHRQVRRSRPPSRPLPSPLHSPLLLLLPLHC